MSGKRATEPLDEAEARERWKRRLAALPVWQAGMLLTDKAAPKPCVLNVMIALRKAPEMQGMLAYNEFAEREIMRAAPPWA